MGTGREGCNEEVREKRVLSAKPRAAGAIAPTFQENPRSLRHTMTFFASEITKILQFGMEKSEIPHCMLGSSAVGPRLAPTL